MDGRDVLGTLYDLDHYERYKDSFPEGVIPEEETVLLEWRPSKALLGKGHPFLAFLMFPGAFTIPFTLLIPVLAFLGILGFMMRHFYEIGLVLIIIVAIVVYGSGALAWWKTFYALTDSGIYLRSGAFHPSTKCAKFSEITDIRLERSIYERLTGRGTISFLVPAGGFRRYRKIRWYTIDHPEKVSDVLRKLILN
jgi:hypothetical protein